MQFVKCKVVLKMRELPSVKYNTLKLVKAEFLAEQGNDYEENIFDTAPSSKIMIF